MRLALACLFSLSLATAASAQDDRYGSAAKSKTDFAKQFDDFSAGAADGKADGRYGSAVPPSPQRPATQRQAPPAPRANQQPARQQQPQANPLRSVPSSTSQSQPNQLRQTTPRQTTPRQTSPQPTPPRQAAPQQNRSQPSTYGSRQQAPMARPQTFQNSTISSSQLPQGRFESGVTLPKNDSASGSSASSASQALMVSMLQSPSNSQLTGQTVTLAEVMRGATSRVEQSRRADAYWDLCGSVADYYLGLVEAEELRLLQQNVPSASDTLRIAAANVRNRLGTSLKAAVASQERLASMVATVPNPLPGDAPLCRRYNTRYDEIFNSRPNQEAMHLDELLPLRYEELQKAAESVSGNKKWVQAVARAQSSQTDGSAVLRSLELLALSRRAFVQIAKDYNRRITRYGELATPGSLDTGKLVAMLIGNRQSVAVNSSSTRR